MGISPDPFKVIVVKIFVLTDKIAALTAVKRFSRQKRLTYLH